MTHPLLIVMSGLPGSGKSTIAEQIAEQLKLPVLSVDPIESAIIKSGIAMSFETGLAAYLVAEALADEQLKLGNSVIIDAANVEEEGKGIWRALAAKRGLKPIIIHVFVSDEDLHKKRLESRVRGLHGFSEVKWDKVQARKAVFTEWKEPTLKLDSSTDLTKNVERAIDYIKAG